jgi:hypothetical protein
MIFLKSILKNHKRDIGWIIFFFIIIALMQWRISKIQNKFFELAARESATIKSVLTYELGIVLNNKSNQNKVVKLSNGNWHCVLSLKKCENVYIYTNMYKGDVKNGSDKVKLICHSMMGSISREYSGNALFSDIGNDGCTPFVVVNLPQVQFPVNKEGVTYGKWFPPHLLNSKFSLTVLPEEKVR